MKNATYLYFVAYSIIYKHKMVKGDTTIVAQQGVVNKKTIERMKDYIAARAAPGGAVVIENIIPLPLRHPLCNTVLVSIERHPDDDDVQIV